MKKLILASLSFLAFAAALRAQDQIVPQPVPSPANIGVWHVIQGIQNSHKHEWKAPPVLPGSLALNLTLGGTLPTGVCSVLLTEARVDANDPGIVTKPMDHSVAIRKAHVPAPPCQK